MLAAQLWLQRLCRRLLSVGSVRFGSVAWIESMRSARGSAGGRPGAWLCRRLPASWREGRPHCRQQSQHLLKDFKCVPAGSAVQFSLLVGVRDPALVPLVWSPRGVSMDLSSDQASPGSPGCPAPSHGSPARTGPSPALSKPHCRAQGQTPLLRAGRPDHACIAPFL